ncbi:unnamed protein product [Notodromas monacha]|uniref:Repressor of RNA polymerase III transcription MAF1 homolog n=1 Tax=Notodromas monacha TaxID=399045 RepID=A0A7R9BH82_9CRUS|nr:unnamed protein product [Notodromas monacha]CAG0914013.1 unnamed protein product [Notodromas monacha]
MAHDLIAKPRRPVWTTGNSDDSDDDEDAEFAEKCQQPKEDAVDGGIQSEKSSPNEIFSTVPGEKYFHRENTSAEPDVKVFTSSATFRSSSDSEESGNQSNEELCPELLNQKEVDKLSARFRHGSRHSIVDSFCLYKSNQSKSKGAGDYVEHVILTPNKLETLRKKRSVSTPNLSPKVSTDCSKDLDFGKPSTKPGHVFREWIDSHAVSAKRSLLPPTPYDAKQLSSVKNTAQETPFQAKHRSYRKQVDKENAAPQIKLPLQEKHGSLLPHKSAFGQNLRNTRTFAPSPAPHVPGIFHGQEHFRTPSQPSRNYSASRPFLFMASGTKGLPSSSFIGASPPMGVEINGHFYVGMKFIGRGGSCKVYEATDSNGLCVAIKVVDLQGLEPEFAAEHRNEVMILSKLQHSSRIVKLIEYELKEQENILYVVLERGELDFGVYLQQSKGKLHRLEIKYLWWQMLSAVKEIHAAGIIHSDLKPGNFLMVFGKLKLIDFGIASSLRPDVTKVTRLGKAGTYNFISPEAISEVAYDGDGEAAIKIGIKSDVWSLGCILYLMVFGMPPFGHIVKISDKEKAICNPNHLIPIPPSGKSCESDVADVLRLLENCLLEALNNALSANVIGEVKISARIESYSCKMVGPDKHLYKRMISEGSPRDLQALSPPASATFISSSPGTRQHHASGDSGSASEDNACGGVLCDAISKRTLCYLKATLNASFSPDYDFSEAKSEEFSREPSPSFVMSSVDTTMNATMAAVYCPIRDAVWNAIDREIQMSDCEVYSYNPDLCSDPFGEEGCLWSFNYFFYNRKLKRVLFFACRAHSPSNNEFFDGVDVDEMDDFMLEN